jgi:serine/threonine protein phosphatase PrpC
MKLFCSSKVEEARPGRGEDRVAIVELPGRVRILVADGAGGVSGGAATACFLCREIVELRTNKAIDWPMWLSSLDQMIKGSGLAAVVVAEITEDGLVRGASVGDCEAWAFSDKPQCLTSGQVRKPLLGEGASMPIGFQAVVGPGTLVLATDGLWKYASIAQIKTLVKPMESAVVALVDGVRLKSGSLQDDVAIALCQIS